MYKNFRLTEEEKKAILEAHSTKGYKQPMNEQPSSKNITEVARIKNMMKKLNEGLSAGPDAFMMNYGEELSNAVMKLKKVSSNMLNSMSDEQQAQLAKKMGVYDDNVYDFIMDCVYGDCDEDEIAEFATNNEEEFGTEPVYVLDAIDTFTSFLGVRDEEEEEDEYDSDFDDEITKDEKGYEDYLSKSDEEQQMMRQQYNDKKNSPSDMNEEDDMSMDISLAQKAREVTKQLSPEEKEILANYLQSNPKDFVQTVKQEVAQEKQEEELGEEDDLGMGDEEFEARRILHKIINYVGVGSLLGVVPAAMFISGGVALGLGITALGANMIKDAAWWKRGGKFTDHHYKAQEKSDYMDMKKSEMGESFWDNIFGKASVGDARDSSMRQSGSSITGRDDSNYGEEPSKENFYIVFNGEKYYEDDIEYADYNDMGDLPRLENGKLIVGNPAWRL